MEKYKYCNYNKVCFGKLLCSQSKNSVLNPEECRAGECAQNVRGFEPGKGQPRTIPLPHPLPTINMVTTYEKLILTRYVINKRFLNVLTTQRSEKINRGSHR